MILSSSRHNSCLLLCVFFFLSVITSSVFSQSDIPADLDYDIISLHEDNIKEETKEGTWVIFFRWDAQDIWSKIPKGVPKEMQDNGIRIGNVDVSKNKSLNRQYGIKTIPCFLLIHEGESYVGKSIENMEQFVLQRYAYKSQGIDMFEVIATIGMVVIVGGSFVISSKYLAKDKPTRKYPKTIKKE